MALIKHRPKIGLRAPTRLAPGMKARAVVVLDAPRPVPIEAVTLRVHGEERVTIGGGKHQQTHRHTIVNLAAELSPPRTISEGRHEFPVHFEIPPDAPPTVAVPSASVAYTASVRVDIDWWPDATAEFVLLVGHAHAGHDVEPRQRSYRMDGDGAGDIEASLASDIIPLGAGIDLAVALAPGHGYRELRAVPICLLTRFDGKGRRRHGPSPVAQYVVKIPIARAEAGLPIHINMPLAHPSLRTRLFEISWALDVVGVRALARDRTMRLPLTLLPAEAGRARRRLAPPKVGSPRLLGILETAARAAGLDFDGQRVHGLLGDVSLSIELGVHDGRGVVLARLSYPDLHLDLDGGAPSGLHRLIGRGLRGFDVAGGRSDLYLTGRDRAQVKAFADAIGADFFDLAISDIGDSSTELHSKGRASRDVVAFCEVIVDAAKRWRAAREAIPSPPTVARHEPAWRDAARRVGGHFEAARMAIHTDDGGDRGAVITEWTSATETLRTTVRLTVEAPIDDDYLLTVDTAGGEPVGPEAERYGADARELLSAITAVAPFLSVSPQAIEAHLIGFQADPAEALALLRRIRSLYALLRGVTGPYR